MKYFVSWTHSDPVYQQYLPGVRVLVSPPNVSQTWRATAWPCSPDALIIDSGAFQHQRAGRAPAPAEVLRQQLQLLAGLDVPTAICHLDVLMIGARGPDEAASRSARSLAQAQWLMRHIEAHALQTHIEPIGVIQGHSVEHIFYVAQALAAMGYRRFALGSLAKKVAGARDEVLRRVEAALEAVGTRLHILGVSSVTVLETLARMGIESADSGAPMKEAIGGGLIYSAPYRRFKLPSAHFREWQRSYGFAEIIERPLPCDCPVCREDPESLMEPRGKRFVNLRAIHNYHHLRRAIEGHSSD
jgi:7-cyano-7-deazaguanine tRNA-ribosyltransferase